MALFPCEELQYHTKVQDVLLVARRCSGDNTQAGDNTDYGFLLHDVWCKTGVMKILEVVSLTPSASSPVCYTAELGDWKSGSVFSKNHNPVASIQCFCHTDQCWKLLDKITHKGPKLRGKRNLDKDTLETCKKYIIEHKLYESVLQSQVMQIVDKTPPRVVRNLSLKAAFSMLWNACQCLNVTRNEEHLAVFDELVCDEVFHSISLPVTAPINDNINELDHSGL